jgi:hypothetical protein
VVLRESYLRCLQLGNRNYPPRNIFTGLLVSESLQALSQSTAQGPVTPTRSDPDWLKVIIYTPSSGAVNFSYMFLGSMLPQPRFVRFRLVAPPTHATFLQDHDKFETLYCQALTSWPNRNASPPWN